MAVPLCRTHTIYCGRAWIQIVSVCRAHMGAACHSSQEVLTAWAPLLPHTAAEQHHLRGHAGKCPAGGKSPFDASKLIGLTLEDA